MAKNGLLERWRALFSIAIGHLGAPSSQRRQRPSKAARTPIEHDERSSSMWRSANPSKGAKASITRSVFPPSVSRAVQCRRSDRTAKNGEIACLMIRPKRWPMAIGKRSPALQEPIFGVFGAPNFTNTPKKQKVIGKKIISGLLTVLRRPVYASGHYKCPKSVHRNYCFLPL